MTETLFGKRVSIEAPSPVALQAAPMVGSTYVRPQQVQTGGNLSALADSLSGLNRALSGFAQVRAAEGQDPNSQANQDFLNSIQGKSVEELRGIASQGNLNRIQRDGLTTLLGSKAASDFRLTAAEWYETEFDKNEGDLAASLEQRRQQFAAGLPDDASRASFFRGTEQWAQQFLAGDLQRKVETATANRNEAIVDEFRLIAEDGLSGGADAKTVVDQIVRQSGLNRDFRGLDGKTQNATLYALAQEYAQQGNVEMVKALLEHDRGGVGPLIKSNDFGVKGYDLINAAQAEADKATQAGSYEFYVGVEEEIRSGTFNAKRGKEIASTRPDLSPAQIATWVDQSERNKAAAIEAGRKEQEKVALRQTAIDREQAARVNAAKTMDQFLGSHEIKDVTLPTDTGGTRVYTAKQQIDDVVNARLNQWKTYEQQLVGQGMAPEQARETVLKDKLNWFEGNAIANPEWEGLFAAMPIAAGARRLAAGGKMEGRLANVAEQFYAIHKLNPAYARSLVKGEDATAFLDAYADARSFLGTGGASAPEDALMEAARVTNMTPTQRAASVPSEKDVRSKVRSALNDGWFSDSFDSEFRDNPINVGIATDITRTYMRRGMSEKQALDRMREDMRQFAVPVNGVAVMTTGINAPKDFGEMAERFLDDFAVKNGTEWGVAEGDELTLMRIAPDSEDLMVMRKEDMMPIGVTFNTQTLGRYRQIKRDEMAVEDATWLRDLDEKGVIGVRIRWAARKLEILQTNMGPDEAKAFLAEREQSEDDLSRIKLEAQRQGVRYDRLNDRWVRNTGFMSWPQEVEPVIEWRNDGTYQVMFPRKYGR
jgi:hypothetical protein